MSFGYWLQLIDLQARMSLKAEASKFYLSYLWWVLEPILFVLVFYLVFKVLLNIGNENFLLFLICGKIPFLWFSKSVTVASNSIVYNKGLIGQADLPKAFFPYASIQESLYKETIVFVVMLVMVVLYGFPPSLNWFWLVPLLIVQYGLIVICSLVGSFLVSFVSDVRMIISMGMMFLMFVSGIFWDVNNIASPEIGKLIMIYNPLAFLIDGYRLVLMQGSCYSIKHLAGLAAVILVGLILIHRLFNRYSRVIAARILNS